MEPIFAPTAEDVVYFAGKATLAGGIIATLAALCAVLYAFVLLVRYVGSCVVSSSQAVRTWWRWYRPLSSTVEIVDADVPVIDLTTLSGRVLIRGGRLVYELESDTAKYIVPQYDCTGVPASSIPQLKEQATSAPSFQMSDFQTRNSCLGLCTFYSSRDGVDSMIGQGCLVSLPGPAKVKRLLTTVHQWTTIDQCLTQPGGCVKLMGPDRTSVVELERQHVTLKSRNGDGDKSGIDLASLEVAPSICSRLSLRAATIARSAGVSKPILYWRTQKNAVLSTPCSKFGRASIFERNHDANTAPGASGAPLYLPSGQVVAIHVGSRENTTENLAIDLTVLYPQRGPRFATKESDYNNADDLSFDPDADRTNIRRIYSDRESENVVFEDAHGRINITTRSHDWNDDDYWTSLESDEVLERQRQFERKAVDVDIMDRLDDGEGGHTMARLKESGLSIALDSSNVPAHPGPLMAPTQAPVLPSALVPATAVPVPLPTLQLEKSPVPTDAKTSKKPKRSRGKKKNPTGPPAEKTEEKSFQPLFTPSPSPKASKPVLAMAALEEMLDAALVARDLSGAKLIERRMNALRRMDSRSQPRTGSTTTVVKTKESDFRSGPSLMPQV